MLELSSFQLDEVQDFDPSAATVLNVTQDHLDWHGTMAAYAAAKARIFGTDAMPDTVMVINRDDAAVEAMIPPPVTVKPTRRGERAKLVSRRVVRFGLDAPRAPGDFGLVDESGMAWLVRAMELDPTIKRKAGDDDDLVIQRLMPADALRIRGRHNASNALAALALATLGGLPARADAARAARIPRRAASRRADRHDRPASSSSTTARAPTSARPSPR